MAKNEGNPSEDMQKTSAYFRTVVAFHNLRDRARETAASWQERGLSDRLHDGWNNTRQAVTSKTKGIFTHPEDVQCDHIPQKYSYMFRPKSRWELILLSGTVCGIEFCYAAETAFVTPILLSLGLSIKFVTMIWCLSPLIGLFLTPILGSMSDSCESKLGRRRPFIIMYSIGILLGLILVPNGHHIGLALGDKVVGHSMTTEYPIYILNGTSGRENDGRLNQTEGQSIDTVKKFYLKDLNADNTSKPFMVDKNGVDLKPSKKHQLETNSTNMPLREQNIHLDTMAIENSLPNVTKMPHEDETENIETKNDLPDEFSKLVEKGDDYPAENQASKSSLSGKMFKHRQIDDEDNYPNLQNGKLKMKISIIETVPDNMQTREPVTRKGEFLEMINAIDNDPSFGINENSLVELDSKQLPNKISKEIDTDDVYPNFLHSKITKQKIPSEHEKRNAMGVMEKFTLSSATTSNNFPAPSTKKLSLNQPEPKEIVGASDDRLFPDDPVTTTNHIQTWSIVFTVIGTVLLDFCSDACQSPSRTYLLDVSLPSDHAAGLSTFTVLAGFGGSIGYAMGALNWETTYIGQLLGGQVNAVFMVVTVIFLVCLITTVTSFPEMPLGCLKDPKMYKEYQEKFKADPSAEWGELNSINNKPKRYGSMCETNETKNAEIADGAENDQNSKIQNDKGLAESSSKSQTDFSGNISDECKSNATETSQTVKVDVADELGCASERPTLKEYLRSIIDMPNSLRILCLTNLFCWMSLVCYSLYFTDFVGECVYGGDPQAPEDSESFFLYKNGVQFGCWGMALYSISCSIYSIFIEALVKKVGARPVYVGGQLVYSAGMVVMAITRHKAAVILLSPTAGIMYSTLFTMPYLLIAHYHSSNQFSDGKNGSGKNVRGIGTDVAAVSSMVFLSQFILSLSMGSVVEAVGSNVVPVCAAALLSAFGAVSATQVTYLDI